MTKPKQFKGKDWHWCPTETGGQCEGHWRIHKPSECKGKAFKFKDSEKDDSKRKSDKKHLKLRKALKAVIEDENSAAESE